MIQTMLENIVEKQNLTTFEANEVMEAIMNGEVPESVTASFLTALRMKDISSDELTGFLNVMKEKVLSIHYNRSEPILDVCGTGGAKFKTFNVSTAISFVLAAGGVSVAKHGNRSYSSKSGSAEILEAVGFNIMMTPEKAEEMLNKHQMTFLFAPLYHPAMKNVGPIRKALGIRTVFNILGPLTNPANVNRQLIGVYDKSLIPKFIDVFDHYKYNSAMIVHGELGADEILTCGTTHIGFLNGHKKFYDVSPKDFGLKKSKPHEIANIDPQKAAKTMVEIFNGESGPMTDFVLANASAGFLVSGKVRDLKEGVTYAKELLENGKTLEKLRLCVLESGGNIEQYNSFIG